MLHTVNHKTELIDDAISFVKARQREIGQIVQIPAAVVTAFNLSLALLPKNRQNPEHFRYLDD